jgi:hypothetical protein
MSGQRVKGSLSRDNKSELKVVFGILKEKIRVRAHTRTQQTKLRREERACRCLPIDSTILLCLDHIQAPPSLYKTGREGEWRHEQMMMVDREKGEILRHMKLLPLPLSWLLYSSVHSESK